MTEQPDFTPRNVAKYVVQAAIQYKATKLTRTVLVDHTSLDSGNPVVKIGASVVGWGVSFKLKPHTDKMVDKTADFVVDKHAKRQAKKAEKKTETE